MLRSWNLSPVSELTDFRFLTRPRPLASKADVRKHRKGPGEDGHSAPSGFHSDREQSLARTLVLAALASRLWGPASEHRFRSYAPCRITDLPTGPYACA